ncbi:MAG: acetyltransferase domain protein [Xanthomonadaceae bacterium]|nr:acetyltransferase domain protein [Xanthomonadaceae bacterium]
MIEEDSRSAWTLPVSLSGRHVALDPLLRSDVGGLRRATQDGALWQNWYANVPTPDAVENYVDSALTMQDAGNACAFAVRDAAGEIVGSTRYYDIDRAVPRVSIGYTWYAARVQRSGLNTEAKLLLLEHAFGALGCIAVAFETSWFNQASRAAIARLGAKQDGVLRSHKRHADGSIRDTVVFSIIVSEWPAVRANLMARLAAHD